MKKLFISLLCCVLICLQLIPCFAAAKIEENEDGSFFIISEKALSFATEDEDDNKPTAGSPNDGGISPEGTVKPDGSTSSESSNTNTLMQILQKIITALKRMLGLIKNQKEATTTITKTKYIYYFSADEKLLWSALLTGDFTYSDTSAQCIDASFSFTSQDSNWKLDNYSCSAKNATASVTFSVVQKSLGVKLQTIEKTITMTCDTNGKVT